jgi:hypothetical protein
MPSTWHCCAVLGPATRLAGSVSRARSHTPSRKSKRSKRSKHGMKKFRRYTTIFFFFSTVTCRNDNFMSLGHLRRYDCDDAVQVGCKTTNYAPVELMLRMLV